MIFFHLNPQVHAADPAAAERIGGTAHRHAAQPIASVLRRFDLRYVPVQFHKDILGDFLSQAAIAGHAPGQRKHHGLVFVHDLFKIRLPVVGHGARFYFLIRTGARVGMQKVRSRKKKVRILRLRWAPAAAQWQAETHPSRRSTSNTEGIRNADGER